MAPVSSPGNTRGPKPTKRRRAREFILGQMRSGLWPPGHILPAEALLGKQCGVSQPTVHRELRRLLAEGLLDQDAVGHRRIAGTVASLMSRTIILLSGGAAPAAHRAVAGLWHAT